VVEDDPILASTVAAILNSNGLAALSATDPFSALDTALVIPPEILIADQVLPGMSGLDLAAHIAPVVPDCDTILFAGQFSAGNLADRVRAPGVRFSYLYKPVHPADLLASVFDILARRGHPLALPKPLRRPSLYDLPSHRDEDPFFGACVVSRHRRRPVRPSGNPV
jgi:DNA-binding response OmpR family regulator